MGFGMMAVAVAHTVALVPQHINMNCALAVRGFEASYKVWLGVCLSIVSFQINVTKTVALHLGCSMFATTWRLQWKQ